MKNTFGSLEAEMTSQLADRDKERESLLARLHEVNEESQCLRRSLKALKGKSNPSEQKKAPDQSDVRAALIELLAENPDGINRVDLKPLLTDQLAAKHHRTAVGLALRIKEVLASGQFVEEDGEVRTALDQLVDG